MSKGRRPPLTRYDDMKDDHEKRRRGTDAYRVSETLQMVSVEIPKLLSTR
jgi:hypothetical protein